MFVFLLLLFFRLFFFFFFNHTATTEIYTLSLHDALPSLCTTNTSAPASWARAPNSTARCGIELTADRKSTRLYSSHLGISYAVFCLKKKKNTQNSEAQKKKTHKTSCKHTNKYTAYTDNS